MKNPAAPRYYEQIESLPYKHGATKGFYHWFLASPGPWLERLVGRLPESARTTFWHNQAVWQWIGLAITLVLAFFLMLGLHFFGRNRAWSRNERGPVRYFLSLFWPLAAISVPLVISAFASDQLRFTGDRLSAIRFSATMVFLLGLVLVTIAAGGRIGEILVSSPRVKVDNKGLDAQLLRIVCRIVSLVVATIVFLQGGQYLGIPLSTLLASAGVGGIAFALAAQDSLKNFFGSMMIILDKPFRVGERIVVGGFDGMVEEIGLRSTRLRLLNGHRAIVPNEEMARSHIENIGRRPYIRRNADLRLPLDTPSGKAARAVEIVREILENHEGMNEEFPPRVALSDIRDDALTIKMIYRYHPPNYWDYLAACQEINLAIKERFEAEGLAFALPASTTRLISGDGTALGGNSPEDKLPGSSAQATAPEA